MKKPITLADFHGDNEPPGWLGCLLVLGAAGFICLVTWVAMGFLAGGQ